MSRFLQPLICVMLCLLANESVRAQWLIQQPIYNQFGVQTHVYIPDQGSAFLGGFGYGAMSRYSPGWYPPGWCGCGHRGLGWNYGYTNVSTNVFILDLREMDRQILESAPPPAPPQEDEIIGRAERARRHFLDNDHRPEAVAVKAPTEREKKLNDPERAMRLGIAAAEAGKRELAKLHFEHAQRLGHPDALAQIKKLTQQVAATRE